MHDFMQNVDNVDRFCKLSTLSTLFKCLNIKKMLITEYAFQLSKRLIKPKKICGIKMKLCIFETAGMQRYHSINMQNEA